MNTIDLLSTVEIMENIKDFNVLLNCFSPVYARVPLAFSKREGCFPTKNFSLS